MTVVNVIKVRRVGARTRRAKTKRASGKLMGGRGKFMGGRGKVMGGKGRLMHGKGRLMHGKGVWSDIFDKFKPKYTTQFHKKKSLPNKRKIGGPWKMLGGIGKLGKMLIKSGYIKKKPGTYRGGLKTSGKRPIMKC